MAQLVKGMYGNEFDPMSNLFGLRCGQCRGGSGKITHNSGWYNRAGEKLGWGDLEAMDFLKIRHELEDGELFIILSEHDSFWNFVTRFGMIGSMCATKPDEQAPGMEYVAEKCCFIIARDELYIVDYGYRKETVADIEGLQFKVLTREAAKQLIATQSSSSVGELTTS